VLALTGPLFDGLLGLRRGDPSRDA
jgi:hypothetical protein